MKRSLLLILSAAAFAGAQFTPEFPVLAFFALAPMIALMAQSPDEQTEAGAPVMEHAEWVLAALASGFVLRSVFLQDTIFTTAVWSVAFALVFALYGFVRRHLGKLTGILPLVLFWLALEYLLLKVQWPGNGWFLADLLKDQPKWTAWMAAQGYLTASVWILLTNMLAWAAFFRGKVNPLMTIVFVASVGVPIALGYLKPSLTGVIDRQLMMDYYSGAARATGEYARRGEWLGRTSAWVSVLIVLFAVVKRKTSQKK